MKEEFCLLLVETGRGHVMAPWSPFLVENGRTNRTILKNNSQSRIKLLLERPELYLSPSFYSVKLAMLEYRNFSPSLMASSISDVVWVPPMVVANISFGNSSCTSSDFPFK